MKERNKGKRFNKKVYIYIIIKQIKSNDNVTFEKNHHKKRKSGK